MAKVKVDFDSQAAARKLLKKFDRLTESKRLLDEVGEATVDRIRFEARRGKPLNSSRRFPRLKDLTVQTRKRLEKFNSTHPSYAAGKSNTTFSGQLLDALEFDIRGGAVIVEVEDSKRTPYQTGPGSKSKSITNKEVDTFLRKIGFRFFTPQGVKKSPEVLKRVNRIVKAFLRRALRVQRRLDKI